MVYKGDIGLYLSGEQVLIPSCGIFITQPKVRQIAQFGESKFLTAVQILTDPDTLLQEVRQGNSQLEELDNFQIILELIRHDETLSSYFTVLFELCCPDYRIKLEQTSIDFFLREEDDNGICHGKITSSNFDLFANTIKELFVFVSDNPDSPDYNPANARAKEIANRIKAGRAKKKQQQGEEKVSLYGTYVSILSIGLKLDMNMLYDYTPFQLYDSFSRYWAKEQYDNIMAIKRIPFADTSSIEDPEEWTRNFYR